MLKELEKINKKVKTLAKDDGYYFGRFFPHTKVMFIGEKPTMPKKKEDWNPMDNFYFSKSDVNFVHMLTKYGLGGSYITDIIKSCGPSGDELTEKDLDVYFPLLLKEIEVIQPEIIVALSRTAEGILKEHLKLNDINIPVHTIYHPSYVQRYNKHRQFESQIRNISQKIRSGG